MQFTAKTLNALEYPKILAMLADCAATGSAKKRALALTPTDDAVTVRRRLRATVDARRLVDAKGYPSFYAEEDVAAAAERAEKGAVLSLLELLRISYLLRSARNLLDYIHTDKPFATVLDEIFFRMLPNRALEDKIARTVLSEDTVADEASPRLAEIRRKIKATNNKIKDTLQSFTGGVHNKFLQDNLVTMRDGRYVVPVKAEYRGEVKGLIHDMSASGATLFVEPMAVVEANNELRRLEAEENAEIERILAELSAECAEFSNAIRLDFLNITELSFIFACASLGDRMKGHAPLITDGPARVDLHRARHPLIDPARVVPIDVAVGEGYRTLVITGPNTGGKTVTLKTVGLLVLMAQSGLLIPAGEESSLSVFSEVLVDIGDEQSIEQSLSTFSSHMVNIVSIIDRVGPRSLVLFDELGSGTDPVEGAALAVAILERTLSRGAVSVSTTHYAELKMYALDTPGVQNASCEFDVETLRPTYRLIVGMPGKSNAFAISEKLGLPGDVIDRARTLLSGEARRFEDVVAALDKSRQEMDKNKAEAERMRREYEVFKREAEIKLKDKIREAEESARRDSEKARQLLDDTRVTSEYILKQLEDMRRREGTDLKSENLAAARREMRERLGRADEAYSAATRENINLSDTYELPRPLEVGDAVYVVPYGQEGVVAEPADRQGRFLIRAGIMKLKMDPADLRLLSDKPKEAPKPKTRRVSEGKVKVEVDRDFKMEIDVRGDYTDDAWMKIDKYLDEAQLSGVTLVHIIHGKGTGALRKYIQDRLRCDRRVKSYRNGAWGEGDLGVTVATLKYARPGGFFVPRLRPENDPKTKKGECPGTSHRHERVYGRRFPFAFPHRAYPLPQLCRGDAHL